MHFERTPRLSYWAISMALTAWSAIGCYACYRQFASGAGAMGPATAYDRTLLAGLPLWYHWVYALAVGAGLFGGFALLLRSAWARPLLMVSLDAAVVQFGYLFATTDIVARKGLLATAIFPVIILAIAAYALWFAGIARRRRWIT